MVKHKPEFHPADAEKMKNAKKYQTRRISLHRNDVLVVCPILLCRDEGSGQEMTMQTAAHQIRKRPAQPTGDTMYRAATVAAAIAVLATVAFF